MKYFRNSRFSTQNFTHDLAVDVGQAEVSAGVAVGELFVVEAEQVEHRGVEVVDRNWVLDGSEAKFVGCSVDGSAFDSAAGHPQGETPVIVVAALD